ncbi:hypothetical protein PARMER_02164 [Parabacteroides merdae ATCC 43184]|nr:hypothetical protein PARMER_02164 [Parabacteroides merdae ATCC 43184]
MWKGKATRVWELFSLYLSFYSLYKYKQKNRTIVCFSFFIPF